jgi:hypothetical protein
MLSVTQVAGFAGAGLAGAAYVPQVWHLVRGRCAAGISRLAFAVWLLASVLVTARAVAIHAGVFIVLGGVQIVATALIVACAARYQGMPCPVHLPGRPAAGAAAGSAGKGPGSRCPAGRPGAGSAVPAGHGGAPRGHVPVPRPRPDAAAAGPGREPDARAFGSQPGPQLAAAAPGGGGAVPGRSRPLAGLRAAHLKETT